MKLRENGYPRRSGKIDIPVNQVVNVIIGEHYPNRFNPKEEQFSGFIGIRKSEDNYKYLPNNLLLTRSLQGIIGIPGLKKDAELPIKLRRVNKGSKDEAIKWEITFTLDYDMLE